MSCWSAAGQDAPASSTPHKPYIDQRYAEGCPVTRRLFEEIRQRGYDGQEQIVPASMFTPSGRPSRSSLRPAARLWSGRALLGRHEAGRADCFTEEDPAYHPF